MILVDTSTWIDHLRSGDAQLVALLQNGKVLGHPWVRGELALSNLALRKEVLGLLHNLPQATVATDVEVITLIHLHRLCGIGIGYVDAHLLASTRLSFGANCGRVIGDSLRRPCTSNSTMTTRSTPEQALAPPCTTDSISAVRARCRAGGRAISAASRHVTAARPGVWGMI